MVLAIGNGKREEETDRSHWLSFCYVEERLHDILLFKFSWERNPIRLNNIASDYIFLICITYVALANLPTQLSSPSQCQAVNIETILLFFHHGSTLLMIAYIELTSKTTPTTKIVVRLWKFQYETWHPLFSIPPIEKETGWKTTFPNN